MTLNLPKNSISSHDKRLISQNILIQAKSMN